MATITIKFTGSGKDDDFVDYETGHGLESDFDDYAEENGFDDWEIDTWDDDYPDPNDYRDLDEYSEIVDKIDEHGEAFRLRYDDIGDFDFDDEYQGCWKDEEDFARNLIEECYDIPDFLYNYIDWENWARDIMMDYSTYEGSAGTHIFRD